MVTHGQRLSRIRPNLLTAATVLVLLLLALLAGLGRLPVLRLPVPAPFILAGAVALTALWLTLRRIEIGIVLLPVVAAAVPFALATGTKSVLVAALLFSTFLIGAGILRMVERRNFRIVRSPVYLPLLGFLVTAVLSTLNSNVTREPFIQLSSSFGNFGQVQAAELSVFLVSGGTLLVVMNGLREMRWIRRLNWTFLALGAVGILGFVLLGGRDLPGFSVGGLFSLWVVLLALGQVLFNAQLRPWARAALLALAGAWFFRRAILEDDWLSGWLPTYAAVLVLCLFRSKRLFVAMLGLSVLGGLLAFPFLYETQVMGASGQGNFLRLEIWAQIFAATRDHLLLGTGPAGYAAFYVTYFPDTAWSTHSNYLDIFAQTGVLGSLFFIWFAVAMFRAGFQARRRAPAGFAAGFANAATAAFAGVLVAMALGDWLIPFVYNQTIAGFRYTVHSWIFLGALAAIPSAREA